MTLKTPVSTIDECLQLRQFENPDFAYVQKLNYN